MGCGRTAAKNAANPGGGLTAEICIVQSNGITREFECAFSGAIRRV
jgi:hypothetical protein